MISIRVPIGLAAGLEDLARARGVTVAALALEGIQAIVNGGSAVAAPQSSKARPIVPSVSNTLAVPHRPVTQPVDLEAKRRRVVRAALAEKPVATLSLPVMTDFPARPVVQRGVTKPKGRKA